MNDASITQMLWQPPLLKLTAPRTQSMPEQPCYVNPMLIECVARGETVNNQEGQEPLRQDATWVSIGSSRGLWVLEMPEQIALMRDKAFGHKPELGAVK